MSQSEWIPVNRQNPCSFCGKPDWCRRGYSEQYAICRRYNDGNAITKNDGSGAEYHLYFVGTQTFKSRFERSPQKQPPPVHADPTCATPEELNKVYTALLDGLVLNEYHCENLKKRGLNMNDINRGRYRSLEAWGSPAGLDLILQNFAASLLQKVPGFYFKKDYCKFAGANGLLIPVMNESGLVVGLRVRSDENAKSKYRWISSQKFGGPGPGAIIHVPSFTGIETKRIRVTEGELKADIATRSTGILTLSLPVVSSWRKISPLLEKLGVKTIVLAIDMDAKINSFVAQQLSQMAGDLRRAGYALEIETWDSRFKGIDDALLEKTEIFLHKGVDVSGVIERINYQAKPHSREDIGFENAKDLIYDAVEKSGVDNGLTFLPEVLDAMALVQSRDRSEWARIQKRIGNKISRSELKNAIKSRRIAVEMPASVKFADYASNHRSNPGQPPLNTGRLPKYEIRENCTILNKKTKDGIVPAQISNFAARIVKEEVMDDGTTCETFFVIEGTLENGTNLTPIRVSSEKFPQMGWPVELWGVRANIGAGMGTKDQLREAIQSFSKDVEFSKTYGHLGWIEKNKEWFYLFCGGAISSAGISTDFTVDVSDPKLRDYSFMQLPEGCDTVTAIKSSLSILDVASSQIIFPVFAATYCAPLGHLLPIDFSVALYGITGSGKTQIAALAQSHFGKNFHGKSLPGNWSSTANALEKQAYQAKDAVFVIDDFAPQQTLNDAGKLNQTAERIFRGAGNRSGRGRLTADMKGRPEYYPRGIVISTGEDLPKTQSIRARILVTEFRKGDVDFEKLTSAQNNASAGRLSLAMSKYIQWLASESSRLKNIFGDRYRDLRQQFSLVPSHKRSPEMAACLMIAFETFLQFAEKQGAVVLQEKTNFLAEMQKALEDSLSSQEDFQLSEDPAVKFLNLIGGALMSGRAHLADAKTEGAPKNPEQFGWRVRGSVLAGHKTDPSDTYEPLGTRIGWVNGNEIMLNPSAAYTVAQKMASEQNATLAISEMTLWKHLAENQIILKEGRRNKLKRTINKTRCSVLVFPNFEVFWENDSSASTASQTDRYIQG